MLKSWPKSIVLRDWQDEAYKKWCGQQPRDFTVEAYPGSGKTIFALHCAHHFLREHPDGLVLIVVPSKYLCRQWADEAARMGIDLQPGWKPGDGLVEGCHGMAVTYHGVAWSPESFRHQCRRPTLAIFDEIHRCGEFQSWGEALTEAFAPATRRITITGTPWRTTGEKIPFVSYDANGVLSRDVSFGYAQALDAEICRPLFFPAIEGKMRWYVRGTERIATFRDPVPQDEDSKRLRTALMADGDWMRHVLAEADRKLTSVREGHPDAGGLILAIDQRHARDIARTLREVTGRSAVLVISDEDDAPALIDQFRRGDDRWLISVRMVSEGVDIKRLRVGVYATNVITQMFFTQAINRISRMIKGLDYQAAFWFIPDDDRIIDLAKRVVSVRNFQIKEQVEQAVREPACGDEDDGGDDRVASPFLPISSTGESNGVIHDGDRYDEAEMSEVRAILDRIGAAAHQDPAMFVKFARALRDGAAPSVGIIAPLAPASAEAPFRVRKGLSKEVHKLVNYYAMMTDQEQRDVYCRLISIDGHTSKTATDAVHRARIDILKTWIEGVAG